MQMPMHDRYRPDQKQISRWILVVTLCLVGAAIAMAYFVHANLEATYQELVVAYSNQQEKSEELTKASEELMKAVEKARSRVKALEREKKLFEKEKGKLEGKGKRLEKDLKEMQPVFMSEQTKTRRLTKKAEELSKAVAEAEARLKDLQESESLSEQEKIRLETKVAKVETAIEVVQRAYIAEQSKTKKLGRKAEELSKGLEEAQARADKLNQAVRPLKEMERVRAQLKALEERQKASGKEKADFKVKGTRLESMLQKLETAYYAEQVKVDKVTRERAEMIALIIRLRVEMVDLNYTLGVNYKKLGMNKHAIEAFQTALDLDPDHADSHFELAKVYNALGDREMAREQFQQYVRLRPNAKDVERVKGWLLRVESEISAKRRQRIWPKGYSSGKSPY